MGVGFWVVGKGVGVRAGVGVGVGVSVREEPWRSQALSSGLVVGLVAVVVVAGASPQIVVGGVYRDVVTVGAL